MCRGISYVHAECNHARKFHVIEECDSVSGIACEDLTVIHVAKITAPALCVGCFRRKEGAIDAEYEKNKRELEAEIARVDELFAKGCVQIERSFIAVTSYRAEGEDDILHAKASRDVSIRLFREEQGVWGDG